MNILHSISLQILATSSLLASSEIFIFVCVVLPLSTLNFCQRQRDDFIIFTRVTTVMKIWDSKHAYSRVVDKLFGIVITLDFIPACSSLDLYKYKYPHPLPSSTLLYLLDITYHYKYRILRDICGSTSSDKPFENDIYHLHPTLYTPYHIHITQSHQDVMLSLSPC